MNKNLEYYVTKLATCIRTMIPAAYRPQHDNDLGSVDVANSLRQISLDMFNLIISDFVRKRQDSLVQLLIVAGSLLLDLGHYYAQSKQNDISERVTLKLINTIELYKDFKPAIDDKNILTYFTTNNKIKNNNNNNCNSNSNNSNNITNNKNNNSNNHNNNNNNINNKAVTVTLNEIKTILTSVLLEKGINKKSLSEATLTEARNEIEKIVEYLKTSKYYNNNNNKDAVVTITCDEFVSIINDKLELHLHEKLIRGCIWQHIEKRGSTQKKKLECTNNELLFLLYVNALYKLGRLHFFIKNNTSTRTTSISFLSLAKKLIDEFEELKGAYTLLGVVLRRNALLYHKSKSNENEFVIGEYKRLLQLECVYAVDWQKCATFDEAISSIHIQTDSYHLRDCYRHIIENYIRIGSNKNDVEPYVDLLEQILDTLVKSAKLPAPKYERDTKVLASAYAYYKNDISHASELLTASNLQTNYQLDLYYYVIAHYISQSDYNNAAKMCKKYYQLASTYYPEGSEDILSFLFYEAEANLKEHAISCNTSTRQTHVQLWISKIKSHLAIHLASNVESTLCIDKIIKQQGSTSHIVILFSCCNIANVHAFKYYLETEVIGSFNVLKISKELPKALVVDISKCFMPMQTHNDSGFSFGNNSNLSGSTEIEDAQGKRQKITNNKTVPF